MTTRRRPIAGAVIVMTKAPVAGRSKTRLCPPLSGDQAAAVAEAALLDTLDAVMSAEVESVVVALDGEPGPWLPDGARVIAQRGDGLDERLEAAFFDVGGPAVIIAMDTPQVTAALLEDALGRLARLDAVLGPTTDGGYWIIGLADERHRVVRGVPMSREDTWQLQVDRVARAGLRWEELDRLTDVDDIADAVAVAAQIPHSRFGRLVADLMADL